MAKNHRVELDGRIDLMGTESGYFEKKKKNRLPFPNFSKEIKQRDYLLNAINGI